MYLANLHVSRDPIPYFFVMEGKVLSRNGRRVMVQSGDLLTHMDAEDACETKEEAGRRLVTLMRDEQKKTNEAFEKAIEKIESHYLHEATSVG